MANKENKVITVQEGISSSMADLFTKASEKQVAGIETVETKNGGLVQSKEYTFVNPVGKRTTMKTFDAEIIASTEKIAMALYGQNVLTFAICRELSKINTKEKLDSLGFKNIGEYASALFDISRVTATQYARIGAIFINDEYRIKSSVLPSGLQKGHLIELLSIVGEDNDISDIEGLYIDGTLTDGMSTVKMRSIVKDWKNGTLAIESTAEEITEDSEKGKEDSKPETGKEGKEGEKGKEDSKPDTSTKFDLQKEVGKVLNGCSELDEFFNNIAVNGTEIPAAVRMHIDEIRAIATAILG